MAKIILKNPVEKFPFDSADPLSNSCSISYQVEESRWTGRQYATLCITVDHPRSDDHNNYKRVFEHSWRVDKEHGDNLDQRLLEYTLDAMANVQVALKDHAAQEVIQHLEEKAVYAVATAADRAVIARTYTDYRERIVHELQSRAEHDGVQARQREEQRRAHELRSQEQREEAKEQERLRQHDQQRKNLEQELKKKLIGWEVDAQYVISRDASTGNDGERRLEYALQRKDLEKAVADYYDPNDNLQSWPIFNPKGLKGWAAFMKEALGDGFYNQVFNAQNDLDGFYLKVASALKSKAQELGSLDQLTEEDYERVIINNFTLESVMQLFERGKDVEVELLRRFKDIHDVNYTRAFEMVKARIRDDRLLYTFTEPGVPLLKSDLKADDNADEFQGKTAQLKVQLRSYFAAHEEQLAVPETPNTGTGLAQQKRVIVRNTKGDIGIGSYGRITSRTYSGFNGNNNVEFSFVTGEPRPLPHKQQLTDSDIVPAIQLTDRYGSIDIAVETLVDLASKEATTKITDKSITRQVSTISQFHLHLDDEILFLERSLEGMKSRFEAMYTKHSKQREAVEEKS